MLISAITLERESAYSYTYLKNINRVKNMAEAVSQEVPPYVAE